MSSYYVFKIDDKKILEFSANSDWGQFLNDNEFEFGFYEYCKEKKEHILNPLELTTENVANVLRVANEKLTYLEKRFIIMKSVEPTATESGWIDKVNEIDSQIEAIDSLKREIAHTEVLCYMLNNGHKITVTRD